MRQENIAVGKVLSDPSTFGSAIVVAMCDAWGTEWFDWEGQTIRMEAHATWGSEIPEVNMNKVHALLAVLTTNQFQRNLHCFVHVCNALNGHGNNFDTVDRVNTSEICWAIAEVALIDPDAVAKNKFDHDIVTYIKQTMTEDGFHKSPRILSPYINIEEDTEGLEQSLSADGIDFSAFWRDQEEKRMEVDSYVRDNLNLLFQQVASLPLHNAVEGFEQDLPSKLQRALADSRRATEADSEGAPKKPFQGYR